MRRSQHLEPNFSQMAICKVCRIQCGYQRLARAPIFNSHFIFYWFNLLFMDTSCCQLWVSGEAWSMNSCPTNDRMIQKTFDHAVFHSISIDQPPTNQYFSICIFPPFALYYWIIMWQAPLCRCGPYLRPQLQLGIVERRRLIIGCSKRKMLGFVQIFPWILRLESHLSQRFGSNFCWVTWSGPTSTPAWLATLCTSTSQLYFTSGRSNSSFILSASFSHGCFEPSDTADKGQGQECDAPLQPL